MRAENRFAIGQKLAEFFQAYEDAGFPADWESRKEEFGLGGEEEATQAAIKLLKSGNTTEIGKLVELGLEKPMIFWPPGGM
jgi:hypothetical protein